MIKIDRNRTNENGDVIKPPHTWFKKASKETKKAIQEKTAHTPKRYIYSHVNLRAVLEELFHYKCAYCESPLPDEGWDSEHYRPKGAVAENDNHHGYYWLIYDWENLFPSCVSCNQIRKDKPIYGDLTYASTAGKGTQFPLKDESARAFIHTQDIGAESPLLLNPCSDNPESYLRYEITGNPIPNKKYKKGIKRAIATIKICHLYRRRLNQRRLKVIKDTVEMLKLKNEFVQEGKIDKAKIIYDILMDDSRYFAGITRAVIKDPAAFGV